MRGSATDFADGILGAAFGKVDVSNLFITLSGGHLRSLAQAKAAGAATLHCGLFVNNVIDSLIVAFAV